MDIKSVKIGLFKGINSLFAYLDDQLILLENSESNKSAHIIFDDRQEMEQSEEFLLANNYNLTKTTTQQLEIIFSKSDPLKGIEHIFFINTEFVVYDNSKIVELTNGIDKSSIVEEVHFLNSNSYFGYYQNMKKNKDVVLIGSPAIPINMTNNSTPF